MKSKELVGTWFEKWESGDFVNLPLSDNFKHTSPFGSIEGKEQYIELVRANKDKFLGYKFEILDAVYETNKAGIRYKARQGDFSLDVSEWHYMENGLIIEIIAYYHIGEIREERQLNQDG